MSTKTEAEQNIEALEFIAPIVEAQRRFDQGITNNLLDSAWESAEIWATRFRSLMNAVIKTNDSLRVADVLDQHWCPDIDRQIAHYRQMRGAGGDVY